MPEHHTTSSSLAIELAGEKLELCPERCLWWEKERTLIVSDIHLGKAAHFRKHGIAIPGDVNADNLKRLEALILTHQPDCVLVLGDLFHSSLNSEWDDFRDWLEKINQDCAVNEFRLVEGNHDILPGHAFDGMRIQRCASWSKGPFEFVHEPTDFSAARSPGKIGVAGHLHPALLLHGKAKQRLRLPGWWFQQENQALIMPNFGTFTGSSAVKMKVGDQFWIATEEAVMPAN